MAFRMRAFLSFALAFAVSLTLGLFLATGSPAQDQDATGDEVRRAAIVLRKVRDLERLITQSEAMRRAGDCDRRTDHNFNARQGVAELRDLRRRGYPVAEQLLADLDLRTADLGVQPCPPILALQPAIERIERMLVLARERRVQGNCRSAGLYVAFARAALRDVEPTGTVPRPALDSWRSQLDAEAGLCPDDSSRTVPETATPCPSGMPEGVSSLNCRCPAGPYRNPVYGSHYYSPDSGLCHAALHAGVIGTQGGSIVARNVGGRAYYVGKARNGVVSNRGGAASRTIMFVGDSDPVEERLAEFPLCQPILTMYPPDRRRSSFRCRCITDEAGGFNGAVYGSGPYTGDSSICTAARHAGVLRSNDGMVIVTAGPGLEEYRPSTSNGVNSRYWGAYDPSMTIEAGSE